MKSNGTLSWRGFIVVAYRFYLHTDGVRGTGHMGVSSSIQRVHVASKIKSNENTREQLFLVFCFHDFVGEILEWMGSHVRRETKSNLL